jgi:hypothetical protein
LSEIKRSKTSASKPGVRLLLFFSYLVILLQFAVNRQAQASNRVTIIDSVHYSQVFGEPRNYRIFLPPGYSNAPGKRYPVIYFMHGWSQRSFGDGGQEYAQFDKEDDNKGDNIANFVSSNDVIVVKSDSTEASMKNITHALTI